MDGSICIDSRGISFEYVGTGRELNIVLMTYSGRAGTISTNASTGSRGRTVLRILNGSSGTSLTMLC